LNVCEENEVKLSSRDKQLLQLLKRSEAIQQNEVAGGYYRCTNKSIHKMYLDATPGLFDFTEIDGIPHVSVTFAGQILLEWVIE
jgi:hypothetical protein